MVTGTRHTPETKAKIARAMTGRTLSRETRAKIAAVAARPRRPHSEATKAKIAAAARRRCADPAERARLLAMTTGRSPSPETRAKQAVARRGERNGRWKGDDIGYEGLHYRVREALSGQPCARADDTCKGPIQIAFKHDTPEDFVKVHPVRGWRYSTRVEDYWPLCVSHHTRYDNT